MEVVMYIVQHLKPVFDAILLRTFVFKQIQNTNWSRTQKSHFVVPKALISIHYY